MKFAAPPGKISSVFDAYRVLLSHVKISDLISSAVFGVAIFTNSSL